MQHSKSIFRACLSFLTSPKPHERRNAPLFASLFASYSTWREDIQLPYFVRANNLMDNPDARKSKDVIARGFGGGSKSGCPRGRVSTKGRGSRSVHMLYDGGALTLTKFPVKRTQPPYEVLYTHVSVHRLVEMVQLGILDPTRVITMKDMVATGTTNEVKYGVMLYGTTRELSFPLHLQVSACEPETKKSIERAGGSVMRVYYTREGLEAILHPEEYVAKNLPFPPQAHSWHPRYNGKFDSLGCIPPSLLVPQVPVRPQGDWCSLPTDTEPPAAFARMREAMRRASTVKVRMAK